MLVRTLVVSVAASCLLACTARPEPLTADQEKPAVARVPEAPASASARAPARPPSEPRATFRLDFTLTITDPGKPPSTSEYTLNLEEHGTGEIRLGKNVPLSTPAPPPSGAPPGAPSVGVARQDVGFLLRGNFAMSGESLLLHSDFEMSSADEAAVRTIHKVSLRGDALVTPGKPALVSSSEDPSSHRRHQLTVTATRLR